MREMIKLPFVLMIAAILVCGICSCCSKQERSIEEIRKEVLGKDYSWVENNLGRPIGKSRIKYCAPPRNASPDEAKKFHDNTIAQIWIYKDYEVVFNAYGIVVRVEPRGWYDSQD